MPALRFIEFEVDAIDDLVLILKESEQTDMLRRIGYSRKKVLLLMRLLNTKADILKTIIKRCGDGIKALDETCLYLGDIQGRLLFYLTLNIERPRLIYDSKHYALRKDTSKGPF